MTKSTQPTIADLINRRAAMRGLASAGFFTAAAPALAPAALAQETGPSTLTFKELSHTLDSTHHVASGYDMQVVVRWGDPVVAGAPAFDPNNLTAAAQEKQFGYNNDYLGLHPLPIASKGSDRFLLVANHEYVNPQLMFAGLKSEADKTRAQTEVEMAAMGGSVIEIAREGGAWKVVPDSKYARRISVNTAIDIAGPAAGHDALKTSADPTGRKVFGMLNNCAGGATPWGTWLTCEENFNAYFGGDASKLDPKMAKRV